MNHKAIFTGRVRSLATLPVRKLCHFPDCLTHASHVGLYRMPTRRHRLRYLCYDHLLSAFGPLLHSVVQQMVNGAPVNVIYKNAMAVMKRIER